MDNPWTFANWNLTAQGQFITKFGLVKAQAAAAEAGTTVGGARPASATKVVNKLYVLNKRISIGGAAGSGSSGDGPPA